jgi:uracil-DNA glycosylase family 4
MSCASCPLAGQQCHGDGPAKAKIVVVGEAPGRTEVQLGRPFVGPSGKLLDATLMEMGVPRNGVYVTNAVMCRPTTSGGQDTAPSKAMLSACSDRLVAEIRAREPLVVLAVGGTAAQRLLHTEDGITKTQGSMKWSEELGTWVVATYHPAAVLHGNTGYFDDIYDTVKRVVALVNGTIPFPPREVKLDWELISEPERAVQVLQHLWASATKIAFDTESRTKFDSGPRPLEDEWLMSQFYAGGSQAWAFNMPALLSVPKFRRALRRLFDKKGITWRMHNSSYDKQVIRANGFTDPPARDSMVLGLGLHERGEQVGLKALSRMYCNATYYEDELVGYSWRLGPQRQRDWLALAKYGCLDAYYTFQLCEVLPALVEAEGTMPLCKGLLSDAAETFCDVEFRGAAIDKEYADGLEAEWMPIIAEAEGKMQSWAAAKGFPQDQKHVGAQTRGIACPVCCSDVEFLHADRKEWRKEFERTFGHDPSCTRCMKRRFVLIPDERLNVRSYPQLQHLAFDILRMQHPDRKRSTEEAFLAYNEQSEFTQHLRAFRERDGLLRTYIRGIGDDIGPDGRVHPDFLLFGTVTGRLSIRNPPLQTIPKWGVSPKMAKLVRRMFVAKPGHVIVDVDYKNLELFIAWHYSKDENLGRALVEQDFHTTTASAIFNTPYDQVTGDQRFNSKFVTFGIAYGRQAYSLAQGELKALTGGNERKAQAYIDRFWGLYPDYHRVYKQFQEDAINLGELRTPMGRVRRWKLITKDKLNHIRNQAVNFPLQSLASDTCLSALIRLNKRLPALDYGDVLFTCHDSLVFEIREDKLHEAVAVIKEEMTAPPYDTHIKLFVDVEYGPSLGEVQPYIEPIVA